MKIRIISLAILTLLLATAGCKKEESTVKGPNVLMTQHKWKVVSAVMINKDGEESEAMVLDCRKDDIRIYENTGKFEMSIGSLHCTDDEQPRVGTWELRENSTRLYMYVEGTGYYEDIVAELGESTLRLRTDFPDYSIIETYVPTP